VEVAEQDDITQCGTSAYVRWQIDYFKKKKMADRLPFPKETNQ
jgi:hypothetical protein